LLTAAIVERVGPDGDVLAINTSVDSLGELRANTTAPNVSYFVGSADVLPLMDESVDVVVAPSDDAGAEAASELFRVLSSGGRISIHGEGELESVFTGAGFSDVRAEAGCLTAVKP
jgi:ubiquinone/menaquinone biosynthesis C-methylase UbiE